MLPLNQNRHHLGHYRQITSILARHGLGWVALELGLGNLLPFHKGQLGHPRRDIPYTRPEHFWIAFEDLGVAFIKLGQVLTRARICSHQTIARNSPGSRMRLLPCSLTRSRLRSKLNWARRPT